MLKKLLYLCLLTGIIGISLVTYALYQNNRDASWPQQDRMQLALDRSVQWLYDESARVTNDHNPALWWMLKEASAINENIALINFYNNYKTSVLDRNPRNVWTPYFNEYYRPEVPLIELMSSYAPYQKFFVYALSCDRDWENAPVIQAQLNADFCGLHYLKPRCVTHQQMGVRLLQQRGCGDRQQLAELSHTLQARIAAELSQDFRVTDSYLQRVLMLAEAGNFSAIKPIWVERILNAQNADGGWGDLHPLLSVGGERYIGLTSTLPAFSKQKSTYHATAQGIWLMTLLLQQTEGE